jgi:hypothetical protein
MRGAVVLLALVVRHRHLRDLCDVPERGLCKRLSFFVAALPTRFVEESHQTRARTATAAEAP